jgi:hypothetical protein
MSLDMLALGSQVREMAVALGDDVRTLADRIAAARDLLAAEAADWEFWRDAVDEGHSRQAWLIAKPLESMLARHDLPTCPSAYAVAGADGSQLDVDRHGIADCWVVNIGTAALIYGPEPSYRAASDPRLGYRDEDLTIQDRRGGREYSVTGPVLAAHRDLYEGLGLADVALTLPPDLPRVALQDGTLIRWTLQGFEPWLKDHFLGDYLSFLETMRALPCPLASYLSRPRSPEVIGLIQFLHVRGDWERWKADYPRRSMSPFRGVTDHLIFDALLQPGQRSARFQSMSKINVDQYPHPHTIEFFYLKVGREIARVEFPAWAAEGDLDLLHAVVYDQCQRGMGYPVALQRAHEQAVIHDGDRRQLEALIERLFAASTLPALRSAKSVSKLRPGL